uniref:AP-1 complex subunit gamma-2 (Trinotate prediction) n=1 Tax=Myxobolus squamalis TaxID=59785 RepID=A0A6B2GEP4_MYXSQ
MLSRPCGRIFYTVIQELAMGVLSSFLQSTNQNFKYVSLSMMSKIVAKNSLLVQRYRNDIFCCINDSNKTIAKRSVELIFHTITSNNVVDSIERLTQHLFVCHTSLKDYISNNIIRSIEKF